MKDLIVIYRILYGTDFLERSIRSVVDVADRVCVYFSTQPWSSPENFPDIRDIEPTPATIIRKNFYGEKVHLTFEHFNTPKNQFKKLSDISIRHHDIHYMTCFMEPDMIWSPGMFAKFVEEFSTNRVGYQYAPQIELWKTMDWRIPQRQRFGPAIYKGEIPNLGFGQFSEQNVEPVLAKTGCYNFGFCLNEKTMEYKHKAALHFSSQIGDSVPAQNWYEEKWLRWTPETTNLEPSRNHTHFIPKAEPYNMPEEMRKYMNENPT